ncbi:MAG: 3-oxoacyl-[acyl-carrier-protein] synthase 2 [Myxococcota bacterium]|nr:3-oxoacyl-[acyl-carrier-protein] synthase 2 [Myxococcota bacterium]
MKRAVVVTGAGLITPLGLDRESTWSALLAGATGIGPISQFDAGAFPCRIAGEVRGFQPEKLLGDKQARHMDRFIQLAVCAAEEAIRQAGFLEARPDLERVGVYIGAGIGGLISIEKNHHVLLERGPGRISPFFIPMLIVNMAAGHVSIRHGFRGPALSHVSACATGAHSIGEAARLIERGDADVMIAGGSEASITPLGVGGFTAMRALSTRNDAPGKASRPFDLERDGFVPAEGAGVLVLESAEFARARGATVLAVMAGYGSCADAHHITAPREDGAGAARCMSLALKDAGLKPEDIGYVNAHATGTPLGDTAEALAIASVFGAGGPLVSSTKSMMGHALGAAGSIEAAVCVLAVRDGLAPPSINLEQPDPACPIRHVGANPQPPKRRAALSNSFGFGGSNASLIFAAAE